MKTPEIVDVDKELNQELLKYFKGEKDGYVQVGPKKWFYPVKYRSLAQDYLNFEVRPDDIWITGVPRSGTTVTQEAAWLLTHNLDFEAAGKCDVNSRVQFFEGSMVMNDKTFDEYLKSHPDFAKMYYADESKNISNALKRLSEKKERRVIKTHFPFELLPPSIIEKNCKVIYVCRFPKDVAVSYFFLQSTSWHINFSANFEKYWTFFKNGNCMFGPYFEHVKQAWERRNDKNFFFVFYEDLRKDIRGYVKKLSEFLEKPLKEDEMNKLVEFLDFDNYKNSAVVKEMKKVTDGKLDFVRKGKVSGWREHFNDEMNKDSDEWIRKNIEEIGIKYPQ